MQELSQPTDWLNIGQLIVGLMGCLISFILAIALFLLGLAAHVNSTLSQQAIPLFMLAGLMTAVGFLNIPSVVFAIRRLSSRPTLTSHGPSPLKLASLSLIALPFILIGGNFISQTPAAWWALPSLNVLALLIPIWWIVEFGRHNLPTGSAQRSWGLVSVGLTITPIVTMLVELVVMLGIIVLVFLAMGSSPVWVENFRQLFNQLSQSNFDLNTLDSFLQGLVSNPLVLIVLLITLGGIMPLIEELLKPLGLWVIRKQILSPAEGFSAGLICGAGFAFIESATLIAEAGAGDWALTVLMRIGTSLLHITVSGLMGWGLASAWTQKRNGRFFLSLLASVGLHGLWNTLAVVLAVAPSTSGTATLSNFLQSSMGIEVILMAVIVTALVTVLFLINRRLQKEPLAVTVPFQALPPSSSLE